MYVPHWLMFDPLFPGRQVFPHRNAYPASRTGTSLTAGSGGFCIADQGVMVDAWWSGVQVFFCFFYTLLECFQDHHGLRVLRVGVSIKSAGFSARASFSRARYSRVSQSTCGCSDHQCRREQWDFRCYQIFWHSCANLRRRSRILRAASGEMVKFQASLRKSGKFWRVSDSIFKSPHLFFGMCQQLWPGAEVRPTIKIPSPKKILDIFSDNAFLSRRIWRQGRTKSGSYPELPRIWARSWSRAPDQGNEFSVCCN